MKRVMLFVLLLLVIVYGCARVGDQDIAAQKKDIEFVITSPGDTVSKTLRFAGEIRNGGKQAVQGSVCLTGLDESIFPGYAPCTCESFNLGEKDETQMILFPTYELSSDSAGEYDAIAMLQYDYRTRAILRGCVKQDPYAKTGCRSNNDILESNVGKPPIIVKSVVQDLTSEAGTLSLDLDIELVHVGDGNIIDTRLKEQCFKEVTDRTIDIDVLNEPGNAVCDSITLDRTSYERFRKEGIKARCTITDITPGEFEPEMILSLDYAYQKIVSKKFTVR